MADSPSSPLSHSSPAPSAVFSTPSSTFATPFTAFTTPDLSKSPVKGSSEGGWTLVEQGQRISPNGFAHLDAAFTKGQGEAGQARSFEWETYHQVGTTDAQLRLRYKRRLGPTEVSYYLGSRGEGIEGGVNDMYLHIGFKARSSLMHPDRLLEIWTELLRRHTLLASSVEFEDYHNIRFCYDPPATPLEARKKARSLMEIRVGEDAQSQISTYLNGPRTLSDQRLAYLLISTPESTFISSDPSAEQEYDFFLFSTHFLGDGMALHATANEFFTLLAECSSIGTSAGDAGEEKEDSDASKQEIDASKLAPAMESKIMTKEKWGKMGWSAAKVEYANEQAKLVGGHAFPRARLGTRHTLVPTVSYPAEQTKRILSTCKLHGSTIAHAMFALSNIAYIRSAGTEKEDEKLPVMLYSALNVRPFLKKETNPVDWYHIAIGYYNIILPSFVPSSISPASTFWHRCATVKSQTTRAVKTPFLASRTMLMALEREGRSIGWEREDDERRAREAKKAMEGLGISGVELSQEEEVKEKEEEVKVEKVEEKDVKVRPKAPSTALMGLSMLGNLDGIYQHKEYDGIQLHSLTTGSRQRPGAILLFAYTFAGKLWISLGYDSNGFVKDAVEKWWDELLKGVDEFLLEREE
ncbi:2-methylcitrate dehydratase [Rhodotorula toruloides ATCC 204091]|uniref:2-methylcitrate dehydratase n=1 Tax=Rhodotorula toruloides TaxID=5286 RepID=A0A0K3CGZ7_RHOTO|nr:2-methylcitrate dehydratase [Rhodotorula toruloides ATCC 204091]KAK4332309.1 2-methylcitrate dehydratase [Rhodotorula toruloides]PRQ72570.1 2-methylcitrate dehydratase [Rhodotorula toruloides]